MGNTTTRSRGHKRKEKSDDESSSTAESPASKLSPSEDVIIEDSIGTHIDNLPHDLFFEILPQLHPVTLLSCQCVSRSWREIFKSNQIWKIICQIYGISTRYLNDDTDYFAVFLSRMALYFAVEKNAEYYLMWHKRIEDSPNLRSVTLREDVTLGRIYAIVGTHFLDVYNITPIEEELARYERHLKNQVVHRYIAAQKLFYIEKENTVLGVFEVTDDYLMNALINRPELITEVNIRDIIKQLLSAFEWLIEHDLLGYHTLPENIRVNLRPNNKVELKVYSALLDFSGRRLSHSPVDQVPHEILVGEPCGARSYSWIAGWMTFFMLTGRPPFDRDSVTREVEAIFKLDYAFYEPTDDHVTPLARDFIAKLIVLEPGKRLTVHEALNHTWMTSTGLSATQIPRIVEGYVHRVETRNF